MTAPVREVARGEDRVVAGLVEVGRGDGSWELVAAVQAGDREAFGRLYERYLPQVQHFLRVRVRDAGLVEDLTSETFLRALRRIDTVSEQCPDPGPWLVRIARNLVFDHAKSARNRLDWVTEEVPEPRTSASGELGVEECAQARADRAAAAATVARCLDGLTPPQRRAVERHEMPVAETAAVLGATASAVKGLRHRGLHAMREQLADEGLTSSQDCYDAAQRRPAQSRPAQRPPRDDVVAEATDAVSGDSSADPGDRDEHSNAAARTDGGPPEVEQPAAVEHRGEGKHAGEVVRGATGAGWDSAPVDESLVDEVAEAVGRVGAALDRLRTVHARTAGGGEEPGRAARLARWHTDDHAGRDEASGDGAVRCVERERSLR